MEQNMDTNSEGFYASLMEVPEHTAPKDDRRSRRQSRVSREIVSQGMFTEHILRYMFTHFVAKILLLCPRLPRSGRSSYPGDWRTELNGHTRLRR